VLLALGLALLSAVSVTGAASLASGDRLLTHPLRLGWVYLLELPWAVALMASVPRRRWWFQPTAIDGVIGLLLALLPVAHVGQVVQREDRLLGESLAHAQYQEAWQLVERLAAVGDYPIQGRPAAAMRKVLMQRVTELRKATAEPLATEATEDERVRRGRDLMSLGRLDEARALLTPLVQQTPEASLYLGAIAEVAGQWPEAAAAYRQTIDRVKQQGATTETSQRWLRAAYERYANNLRRAGDPLEAERQLKQGMEDWPSLRDLFLLQLGYHYQMAGRVWESRDFFEQAAVANPALAAEVQVELEKLRTEAQGCLLRPTRGAAR
jgi:tetratricopeptide (TPR) repeat protein